MEYTTEIPKIPKRSEDGHKGSYGKVLVIAGSVGMSGAAYLTTMAALRGGAGLVVLLTPSSIYSILASKISSALVYPLYDTPQGTISTKAETTIVNFIHESDVLAIGPGISRNIETSKLILHIIPRIPIPAVVDADALNIISENISVLRNPSVPMIITPHPGEMSRLTKTPIGELQKNREKIAFEFAKRNNVIVVLKGNKTVVTDGNRTYVNRTGNPGMATGGSGDVLTGLISALIGQKIPYFDACVIGTYIHGLAADIAVKSTTEISLIASDILKFLPRAFRRVYKS